MKIDWV